jgi:hypothetical protein
MASLDTPEERITQIHDWHDTASINDSDWRDRAEEAFDHYWGNTWTGEELEIMREREAPALSINRTQAKVNMLSAIARLNRFETVVKAETDKRDVPTANILTNLMRHIGRKNDQDFLEAWQFHDGAICGRGYFAGDVTFEKNFFGDVSTRYINPFAITFDPTALMPDLSDAEFIIEEQWFTLSQLEMNWRLSETKKGRNIVAGLMGQMGDTNNFRSDYFVDGESRIRMGQFRVMECWYRQIKEGFYLVNIATGHMQRVPSRIEGLRAVDESGGQLFLANILIPELKVSDICCNQELFNGESPFSSTVFPIFPFFCYNAGGRQDGIVEAMKDPQLETNKRRSQMLHLLNHTANSPIAVDQDSVTKGMEWLREHISEPGVVIEMRPGTRIDRLNPVNFPAGLLELENLANRDFFDVAGFSPETLPTSSMGSAGSGRAIALRQQQGMNVLSLPMDNQRLTRRAYGRWLLRTIQDYYTTERVIRIEGPEGIDEYVTLNGQGPEGILNDVTIGDYDVVVSEEPINSTNRQAMFNTLVELAHQGVPIPPDIIVELADPPQKDKILARLRDAQKQAGTEGPSGGKKNVQREPANAV